MVETKGKDRRAFDIAKAALDSMMSHGVVPDPQNFTVWYEYCSGLNPDISAAIDAAINEKVAFTAERSRELYEQFFGLDQVANVVHETGHQIQEQVGEILASLGEAGRDQSAFGEKLAGITGQMSESMSSDAMSGLVRDVLQETRDIITKNATLESKLENSSREIETLQQDLGEVRREAMTDGLTGIANRKHFDLVLRKEATEAAESGEGLCLLLTDIDHFKKFNDTYGHRVGDEVLRVVARTLKDGVKGRDTAARYGGEEFAVILPQTSLQDAVTVADQIRVTLASRNLQNRKTGDSYGKVTLSIGVARYRPGESTDELVERADAALYRAKDAGRNRVETESVREQILGLAG
jgi:diguanylate cyclase